MTSSLTSNFPHNALSTFLFRVFIQRNISIKQNINQQKHETNIIQRRNETLKYSKKPNLKARGGEIQPKNNNIKIILN